MFRIDGVSKAFERKVGGPSVVLERVDLAIPRGRITVLLGPSGCGKTTLLNLMAGRLQPSRGEVWHEDAKVTSINTRVGYITQHDNLLPWRTVEQNVAIGLELRKVSRRDAKPRVAEALRVVGLSEHAGLYPSQLSGGMRKRASLARTLITRPATILMDEPFGALDAQLRSLLQEELLNLVSPEMTVVFVTHDLDEAMLLGDRVVVMAAHPGRILCQRDIDIPRGERSLRSVRSDQRFVSLWSELWEDLAVASVPGRPSGRQEQG